MSSSPRSSAGPLGMIDGTMPEWQARVEANPFADFVDYCLRGVGQVVFMNNPITGLLIMIAIFVASAWLGVAALIGLVASTFVGILSVWTAISSGRGSSASMASSSAPPSACS